MLFDPEQFSVQTIQGKSSTEAIPVPEGIYASAPRRFEFSQITTKNGPAIICKIDWPIVDEVAQQATGRPQSLARQTIWIDTKDVDGKEVFDSDKGMNVGVGRLREALDQNTPGQEWNFHMIIGVPARIMVQHRSGKDSQVYAEVTKVFNINAEV